MRMARRVLFAGLIVTAIGVFASMSSVAHYLAHPRGLNSMSGLVVFRREYVLVDDPRFSLVQYLPFEWGGEPLVVGVGITLVVASIVLAAAVWEAPAVTPRRTRANVHR